jgi:hypothetical protein
MDRQPLPVLKPRQQPGYGLRYEPEVVADLLVRHRQRDRRSRAAIRELVKDPEDESGQALLGAEGVERKMLFQPGDFITEEVEKLRSHRLGSAETLDEGRHRDHADDHSTQCDRAAAHGTVDQRIQTQHFPGEVESADPLAVVMRDAVSLQRSAVNRIHIVRSVTGPVQMLATPQGPRSDCCRNRSPPRIQLARDQLGKSLCGIAHRAIFLFQSRARGESKQPGDHPAPAPAASANSATIRRT